MSKIEFARPRGAKSDPAAPGVTSGADSSGSATSEPAVVTPTPAATTAEPLEPDVILGEPENGAPAEKEDPLEASSDLAITPEVDLARKHRRRRAVALVCVGAVGLYGFSQFGRGPVTVSGAPSVAATPQEQIAAILQLGEQWVNAHGNFDGFAPTLPSGVLVGASGPGMVVSVKSGSACWYSGILPSGTKPIYQDQTNSACSVGLISQVVTSLRGATVTP